MYDLASIGHRVLDIGDCRSSFRSGAGSEVDARGVMRGEVGYGLLA